MLVAVAGQILLEVLLVPVVRAVVEMVPQAVLQLPERLIQVGGEVALEPVERERAALVALVLSFCLFRHRNILAR
jgi:hypothetical protein